MNRRTSSRFVISSDSSEDTAEESDEDYVPPPRRKRLCLRVIDDTIQSPSFLGDVNLQDTHEFTSPLNSYTSKTPIFNKNDSLMLVNDEIDLFFPTPSSDNLFSSPKEEKMITNHHDDEYCLSETKNCANSSNTELTTTHNQRLSLLPDSSESPFKCSFDSSTPRIQQETTNTEFIFRNSNESPVASTATAAAYQNISYDANHIDDSHHIPFPSLSLNKIITEPATDSKTKLSRSNDFSKLLSCDNISFSDIEDFVEENDRILSSSRSSQSTSSSFTCAVCLTTPPEAQLGHLVECEHTFCIDCIVRWSSITNQCPLCKTRFYSIQRWKLIKKTKNNSSKLENDSPIMIRDDQYTEDIPVETNDIHSTQSENADDEGYVVEDYECSICHTGDHEEVLLLCDGCDQAYHTYCLGIGEVPEGSWFCAACEAESAPFERPLGRRIFQQVVEYWTNQEHAGGQLRHRNNCRENQRITTSTSSLSSSSPDLVPRSLRNLRGEISPSSAVTQQPFRQLRSLLRRSGCYPESSAEDDVFVTCLRERTSLNTVLHYLSTRLRSPNRRMAMASYQARARRRRRLQRAACSRYQNRDQRAPSSRRVQVSSSARSEGEVSEQSSLHERLQERQRRLNLENVNNSARSSGVLRKQTQRLLTRLIF